LPVINWHLAAACLLLVVSFRSSGNLAAAYGLAVTATMVITSVAFGLVVVRVWRQPLWVGGVLRPFYGVWSFRSFLSSLLKFANGGWFAIAIASAIMALC
jgi:KUP system potassium uptake protein